MQIKVKKENWKFWGKFFVISFFNYILIWGCKHMFSTNFSKIYCSFSKNNIFEKSKMAAKMALRHIVKLLMP